MVEELGKLGEFDIYKAEFSMGLLDYNRWHKLLVLLDELAILVKEEEIGMIHRYFAVLHQLYINLRSVMYEGTRVIFDRKIEMIKKLFLDWKAQPLPKKFPQTLVDSLVTFHQDLLEMKQKMGLGIIMERQETYEEKLARASGLEEFEYAWKGKEEE